MTAQSAAPAVRKKSNPAAMGCLAVVVIIIGFGFIAGQINNNKSPPLPCVSDWQKCTDNGDLVNNYAKYGEVQVECESQATHQAKYGTPKWPWLSFGTFLNGTDYVTSGKVVAIERDAQFQNGFGAMVHSRVTRSYDLRAHKVLWVTIEER